MRGQSRVVGGVVVLLLTGVAAAPGDAGAGEAVVDVRLLDGGGDGIALEYKIKDFSTETVMINGHEYTQIILGKESPMKVVGEPELPNVCRSIIIPDDASMVVSVLASNHYELQGIDVAPSKGFISRSVDPADVPYTFAPVYDVDAFYPGELASLREPYILRDHRGVVVEINPFQYNPVARTLRVYTELTVEVTAVGPGKVNVLRRERGQKELSLAFHRIYTHHFINYDSSRYDPLDEIGDMLIIVHDPWEADVQPLANQKIARGIDTTVVRVSTIGNTAPAIKAHIQAEYNAGDLAFVLLVGDSTQVATPFVGVSTQPKAGAADPTYALVAGGDHYPDILVGRFSAETAAQVDTQVLRSTEYVTMIPPTTQAWYWRGTGVASNQGAGIGDDGESDRDHLDNIRQDLLNYQYTSVDRIYDPTATAAQVSNAVNAGRGIINYTGHGSRTSWSTTGFSHAHFNALTNDNELPFIFSVACVNGEFDAGTCFAEAWLRATHGAEPTGAIAMYASSVLQSWAPPMCGQDEFADRLVSQTYTSFGALCFAGSCQMMDEYGAGGREMFDTWHVFGDPELPLEPTGACWDVLDGTCRDYVTEIDCFPDLWFPGTLCSQFVPPVQPGPNSQLIVLLDRTGSMEELRNTGNTRCVDALEQAKIDVASFPGNAVSVWTFASSPPHDFPNPPPPPGQSLIVNLTSGFVNKGDAIAALNTLNTIVCEGWTPLAQAACQMVGQFTAPLPQDRVLAISSDGGENYTLGPCSGPWSNAEPPPPGNYDAGSWQKLVWDQFQGAAIVQIRHWAAFEHRREGGIDLETGQPRPRGVSDALFFQDLAKSTGGSYNPVDDLDPNWPDPSVIPTVSEWGLIVMGLLLLTGAKVYFGRRRQMKTAA